MLGPVDQTRLQCGFCMGNGLVQGLFVRQVFEKVTRENQVDGIGAEGPGLVTILLMESNSFIQVTASVGIQVHCVSFAIGTLFMNSPYPHPKSSITESFLTTWKKSPLSGFAKWHYGTLPVREAS